MCISVYLTQARRNLDEAAKRVRMGACLTEEQALQLKEMSLTLSAMRDQHIWYLVKQLNYPMRGVARFYELTPARVSQIVSAMEKKKDTRHALIDP